MGRSGLVAGAPPHPKRDESLALFKLGLPNGEVAERLDTSPTNVLNWRKHFHSHGLLAGVVINRRHPDDGLTAAELWAKHRGVVPYSLCADRKPSLRESAPA
jgi:hypothetical protein